MAEPLQALLQFAATTQWEDLPPEVREHAKLVLLDTVGVMLAGSEQPEVRELQSRLGASAGRGASLLARGCPVTDAGRAALINGIAGRSIELCEGHVDVSCQAAVQIVPGLLATAEDAGGNGRALLTALVVGYEVAIRIAAASTRRPLAHPNGQAALLGGIAATARLRGFTPAQTHLATRIGATLLLTASYTNAINGATVLNVAGGMSGFASVLAPELALAGFIAQDHAIEQTLGSLAGDGFDPSGMLDGLGTHWEICRNHFRLRACCNPIYPALDALEDALAALNPRAEDIAAIEVETYRFAAAMRAVDPPNSFGARYSLPHAAAALIVKGDLGNGSFLDAVVHDPDVAALRRRVQVTENPAMTAALPRQKPARVTLILEDGRRSTHAYEEPRRDVQQPYAESDIRGKFRELASHVLTRKGVEAIEQALDHADRWDGIEPFIALLRRHSRPPAAPGQATA